MEEKEKASIPQNNTEGTPSMFMLTILTTGRCNLRAHVSHLGSESTSLSKRAQELKATQETRVPEHHHQHRPPVEKTAPINAKMVRSAMLPNTLCSS